MVLPSVLPNRIDLDQKARVWVPIAACELPFSKDNSEPTLADAGFSGEQYYLALATLCSRPAPQQQFGFFVAPDESSQTARVQRLEAAFHGTHIVLARKGQPPKA
jgi:hypothetical protein